MEVEGANLSGGSLQISTDVVAKIAKIAALEIDGVKEVSAGSQLKSLLGKASLQKPVTVQMQDGVADVTLELVVEYGCRINTVSEKVQENVKGAIQNMTGITVAHVNIVVAGLSAPQAPDAAEE